MGAGIKVLFFRGIENVFILIIGILKSFSILDSGVKLTVMSIPNEHERTNSEVKQESYTDPNGNTHTRVTRTSEDNLAERDENNATRGLLLGIIVTSLLSVIVGGVWYFNQSNQVEVEDNTNTVPVLVPVPTESSPTTSPSPEAQTTIIERTKEVPVFVPVPEPQQQVTPPRQPDINITVPPQQPTVETTPSPTPPTPNPTQSPTSTSENEGGSSTNTVTPSPENDPSDGGSSTPGDTTTGGSGQ